MSQLTQPQICENAFKKHHGRKILASLKFAFFNKNRGIYLAWHCTASTSTPDEDLRSQQFNFNLYIIIFYYRYPFHTYF